MLKNRMGFTTRLAQTLGMQRAETSQSIYVAIRVLRSVEKSQASKLWQITSDANIRVGRQAQIDKSRERCGGGVYATRRTAAQHKHSGASLFFYAPGVRPERLESYAIFEHKWPLT